MRKLVAASTLVTLVSVVVGCGVSTTEIGVGNSVSVGVHRARTGHVAVDVKLGGRTCETTRIALSWEGGAARVNAC
jgi:hypothetical protein